MNHKELCWSIFQHYEILPTPLLDVTQSIHVACSFACIDNTSDEAIIYMLGLEAVNSSIFYSYYNSHQLIRLLSVMPKIARRPFYQQGYLIANFPTTISFDSVNYSIRLLGKFLVNPHNIWLTELKPLSKDILYPNVDSMKSMLEPLKEKYKNLW